MNSVLGVLKVFPPTLSSADRKFCMAAARASGSRTGTAAPATCTFRDSSATHRPKLSVQTNVSSPVPVSGAPSPNTASSESSRVTMPLPIFSVCPTPAEAASASAIAARLTVLTMVPILKSW